MHALTNLLRIIFLPVLLCGAMWAGRLSAQQTPTPRYEFPGVQAGAMAFDGQGGLWVVEAGRSEKSTKIYYLKDGKVLRTLEVPLRWICSIAVKGDYMWATNANLNKIDLRDGKVLSSKELTPPTDRTGLAFFNKSLILSNRMGIGCALVLKDDAAGKKGTGLPAEEDPLKWPGGVVRCKAGALVCDGKDVWMLRHEFGILVRPGPGAISGEKGLVIPQEYAEHTLEDIDWDGESFWVLLRKRLGARKHDHAIIKINTVDYPADVDLPKVRVRINFPHKSRIILQRTEGSPIPREFSSYVPPAPLEEGEPSPAEPPPPPPLPDIEEGEYALPVGEYRVLEYAWYKTDEENYEWRVKVWNRGTLNIKPDGEGGKPQEFRIADRLSGKFQIKPPSMRWQQGRYSLQFCIVDSMGCKAQLVRVLKTAEASFEMRGRNGQKIAGGFFAPGIDSYCGYQVRVPGHAEMPLKVKPFLDSGPIDVKLEDVVIEELP